MNSNIGIEFQELPTAIVIATTPTAARAMRCRFGTDTDVIVACTASHPTPVPRTFQDSGLMELNRNDPVTERTDRQVRKRTTRYRSGSNHRKKPMNTETMTAFKSLARSRLTSTEGTTTQLSAK
jgi:hypothetical protein